MIPDGGTAVTLSVATDASQVGSAVHLGIRPEDLSLSDDPNAPFRGTVSLTESLGEVTLVYVDTGRNNEPFVAKLPGEVSIERGTKVALAARPGAMRLFGEDGKAIRDPATERAAA